MLAVLDYLRRQKRPIQGAAAKTSRRIVFEDTNQNFTIASLSDKSKEETGISLQDLLIEVYRSIGEPDSLYGCGGGTILHPLTRIRTYEHEAMWGRALISYDLHTTLSPVARQAGIIQALQNFGLCNTLVTYLKGLECETAEWGAELQEIRYQAAWRNTQWDCVPSVRDESTGPGYHESMYCALQSLRDKEFSTFHESLRYARVCEVEELCRESLESVYSLYPTLCKLQGISELESIGQLLSGAVTDNALGLVYSNWQQQSQLLKDSDFSFQEPILALRTVIQETLLQQEAEDTRKEYLRSVLTQHLMELSKVARTAGNTQLAERAVFQMKQHSTVGYGVSPWQLEEAQVFWAKREEGLALGILRQMIEKLSDEAECLRLCGNWLAETRLESPGIILEKYLEKVLVLDPVFQSQNIPCKSQLQLSSTDAVEVIEDHTGGTNSQLQSGKMQAFLALARFSDAQYQSIENYRKSSEFENKQALLEKAKQEVGLMREYGVRDNKYTVKVQRELELDVKALSNLQEDRKRFLCKAVENYIKCLQLGEEHDMWIFRLCSLWLENSTVQEVNGMLKHSGPYYINYGFQQGQDRPPPYNLAAGAPPPPYRPQHPPSAVPQYSPSVPTHTPTPQRYLQDRPASSVRLYGSNFLLQAYSPTSQSWKPVCADYWSDSYGKSSCEQIGYSSLSASHKTSTTNYISQNTMSSVARKRYTRKTNPANIQSLASPVVFAASHRLMTRCPLELILKNVKTDEWKGMIAYKDYEKEFTDPSEVEREIKTGEGSDEFNYVTCGSVVKLLNTRHNVRLHSHDVKPCYYAVYSTLFLAISTAQDTVASKNNEISTERITLKIESRTAPDLTLIDLPGIARNPVGNQPQDIEKTIKKLINSYIKRAETINLVVIPCNTDIATAEALQMAREVDPSGERTLAVLTKPDLIDKGAEEQVNKLLRNELVFLQKGYLIVRCRGQQDIDDKMSLSEALKREMEFFKSNKHFRRPLAEKQASVPCLADRLTSELVHKIKKSLSSIEYQLQSKVEETNQELALMGEAPSDDSGKKNFLSNIASDRLVDLVPMAIKYYQIQESITKLQGEMFSILQMRDLVDELVEEEGTAAEKRRNLIERRERLNKARLALIKF
ncbi:UNVERIFIED_CONTAM: hypothetical protein FKN15_024494 [Acipenser sinensis]